MMIGQFWSNWTTEQWTLVIGIVSLFFGGALTTWGTLIFLYALPDHALVNPPARHAVRGGKEDSNTDRRIDGHDLRFDEVEGRITAIEGDVKTIKGSCNLVRARHARRSGD